MVLLFSPVGQGDGGDELYRDPRDDLWALHLHQGGLVTEYKTMASLIATS